jgi:cytochrome c553
MKVASTKWALPAAILAVIIFPGALRAEEKATTSLSPQALQAKIEYCSICHGMSGQGYRGASPIPRLAGQQVEYIENQLAAFIEHRRDNIFMYNVAHVLAPEMRAALAKHFHELNPKPTASAPKELVPAGKKIFEEGLPEANVPPCASCHGPDAKGNGQFPRLAGQSYAYIQKALATWDKVRGRDPAKPDTSAIMQPIAHGLTAPQISAVAAYLDYHE